ncbi:MAG: hypothetical protein HC927_07840 [Deltaproteobacteria bacterium]|nr:hypothetical protein [Deltaproteobacteria bacterium]
MIHCKRNLSLLAFSLLLCACADDGRDGGERPVVGEWESIGEDTDHWARMLIEPDLDGEATIDAYFGETLLRFEFDIEVWQSGNEWEFDMACKGSVDCSEYDFVMECKLAEGVLSCEGDGPWTDYLLEWTRK